MSSDMPEARNCYAAMNGILFSNYCTSSDTSKCLKRDLKSVGARVCDAVQKA